MAIVNCTSNENRAKITDENGIERLFNFRGIIFGYSAEIVASFDPNKIYIYDERGKNISHIYFYGKPGSVSGGMVAGFKGNEVIIYNKRGDEINRYFKES